MLLEQAPIYLFIELQHRLQQMQVVLFLNYLAEILILGDVSVWDFFFFFFFFQLLGSTCSH